MRRNSLSEELRVRIFAVILEDIILQSVLKVSDVKID